MSKRRDPRKFFYAKFQFHSIVWLSKRLSDRVCEILYIVLVLVIKGFIFVRGTIWCWDTKDYRTFYYILVDEVFNKAIHIIKIKICIRLLSLLIIWKTSSIPKLTGQEFLRNNNIIPIHQLLYSHVMTKTFHLPVLPRFGL